jgi:hypothetical protein
MVVCQSQALIHLQDGNQINEHVYIRYVVITILQTCKAAQSEAKTLGTLLTVRYTNLRLRKQLRLKYYQSSACITIENNCNALNLA